MIGRLLLLSATTFLPSAAFAATSYTAEEVVKALRACVKAAYTWKSPPAPRRCENDVERILGVPDLKSYFLARGYFYRYERKGVFDNARESYFVGKIQERREVDGIPIFLIRSKPLGIAEFREFSGRGGHLGAAMDIDGKPAVFIDLSQVDSVAKRAVKDWKLLAVNNKLFLSGRPEWDFGMQGLYEALRGRRDWESQTKDLLLEVALAHELDHARRLPVISNEPKPNAVQLEALAYLAEIRESLYSFGDLQNQAQFKGSGYEDVHPEAARIVLGGLMFSGEIAQPRDLYRVGHAKIVQKADLIEQLLSKDFKKFSELFLASYAAHKW